MTNVVILASRSAAPTAPTKGNHTTPLQAYGEAHNALAMALHYLRTPGCNLQGATRKAVQALAALRRLDALAQGGAA